MKKSIITTALFSLTLAAFAADFGGTFTNISKFADQTPEDGLKLDQKDAVSLWFSTPFGSSDANNFLIMGTYQFERNFGLEKTIQYVDLDTARVIYNVSDLTLTAGRFFWADMTGRIYAQNGDGASVTYAQPSFNVTAYGFYTGLLNSQTTTILDPEFSADPDKLYDMCPKYFAGGLKACLPGLMGEQTVSAEGIFTTKLSGTTNTRAYAEAQLSGPLTNNIYYDVTGAFGFSKYDEGDFEMSNLSVANLNFYPPLNAETSIGLSAVYASGEQGPFKPFVGFTSSTAVESINEEEYTSLAKAGINASVKPVRNLLLLAGADAVFDAMDDSIEYKGFQYNAKINWQIVSDVLASAGITQYFDSDDSDINKTSVTIKAVISF
ncbi:MAG: hypothetical protein IKS30_00300 [Treponema sp.]|nr:hypothetical protein [Treponema sp.]